jgi:hypothetical protein
MMTRLAGSGKGSQGLNFPMEGGCLRLLVWWGGENLNKEQRLADGCKAGDRQAQKTPR